MPPRDPLTWPRGRWALPTLHTTMKRATKRPFIGVTQGGSSHADPGCKSAATDGKFKPTKTKKD